uniref:C2H2-type domain-containing protein n=1 Tax=Globodera pallida TaxID=36090 RepID=A0A183BYZ9_GLOPA
MGPSSAAVAATIRRSHAVQQQQQQQQQQPTPVPHVQTAPSLPPHHGHQQQQQPPTQMSAAFLPQQLLEANAQGSNVNASGASVGAVPSASAQLSAATLGFYQQLFALQQAQQQQHGGGGASGGGSAAATTVVATLPQQFNTALHLQNSSGTAVLPQQLASAPSGASQGGLSVLLGGLLGSNTTLLHSLMAGGSGTAAPQTPGATAGGGGNALLTALAAQLLLPQQQQIAQPPANQLTASLLQMLNPATATLYAYQNYLQQQTPAPTQATAGQLQFLAQLLSGGVSAGATGNGGVAIGGGLGGGGGLQTALAALSGGQQQNLLSALAVQQVAQQQQQAAQQQQQQQAVQQQQVVHQQQQAAQQQQQQVVHQQQQAAQQQQQQHVAQQQQPSQQEETRILLEQLIRQQQSRDQQQQQIERREREQLQKQQQQMLHQQLGRFNAAVASGSGGCPEAQAPQLEQSPTMTATAVAAFGSAQEQLQQQQHHTSVVVEQQLQQQLEQIQQQLNCNIPVEQQSAGSVQQQRQSTPAERLLTSEAVQDRISRLISENEAIVEPNPVLLKRRPYQRQGTSNSMTSQTSETAGPSQRCSPGVRSPGLVCVTPKLHPATTRSFSLHEVGFLRFGGGSLTSGQPINRHASANPSGGGASTIASLTCNFCHLKFPNEAGLDAHEPRCSKKDVMQQQQTLQKQQSQPQFKLSSQQQQFQQQQQQQHLEHQSTIAALVGGGKGVARDLIINGGGEGGRTSVPSSDNGAVIRTQQPPRQLHLLGQSSSDSRLKKRGLAADDACSDGVGGSGSSSELLVDVVKNGLPEPGLAESSKMARIECSTSTTSIDLHRQQSIPSGLFEQHVQLSQQRSGSQETQHHLHQDVLGTSAAQQHPQQLQQQRALEHHQQQQQQQPVLTMRDAIIFAITYSTDLRSTVKMPYFLTLTPADLEPCADLAAGGAATVHLRGRTRNITSETFVCLNKVRPTASEQRDNCSAYSVGWPPPSTDFAEERLLAQLFLSARTARMRQDSLQGDYTLAASPASTQLRTTHSSFWAQQQLKAHHLQHVHQRSAVEVGETAAIDTLKVEPPAETSGQQPRLQPNTSSKLLSHSESIIAVQHQHTADGGEDVVKTEVGVDDKENSSATNALKLNILLRKAPPPLLIKLEKKLGKSKFELNSLTIPRSSHNDEMEVYIRGRGRGRYVCERCGIRCKKPSMLKKHLRSHTNIRPFACSTCNFSFKTKGNLTKHLVSKAHRRKVMDADDNADSVRTSSEEDGERGMCDDMEDDEEEDGVGRLVVAEEEEEEEEEKKRRRRERWDRVDDWDDDDDDEADDDEEDEDGSPNGEVPPPPPGTLTYRRFGQENVLVERETHTPPTLWMLMCPERSEWNGNGCSTGTNSGGDVQMESEEEMHPEGGDSAQNGWERGGEKKRSRPANLKLGGWPEPDDAMRERGCHSAPPAALCSPDHSRTRRRRNQLAKVLLLQEQKHRENNMESRAEAAEVQQNRQTSPPPLTNFIPQQPRQQQQPPEPQPSLAAQLAVGLLASAPFHHGLGMPIGVAYPYGTVGVINTQQQSQQQQSSPKDLSQVHAGHQQQQLMFSPLEHHQQTSAFAPPALASSSQMFDSAVTVAPGLGTTTLLEAANSAFVANDSLLRAQSTLGAFLATDAQQLLCPLCGRKFRKESELSLHRQTHLIEQNAAARQKGSGGAFQCGDCPTIVRSKALLARHSENVHGTKNATLDEGANAVPCRVPPLQQHLVPSMTSPVDPSGVLVPPSGIPFVSLMLPPSVSTAPGGPALAHSHHRNFLCTDCNLGFRSHGVLAKHLRSKNHVKTLVSLGKLPEEANHLLAKEHSKVLGSIDAGDCEKALHSTKQLLTKMREQLGLDANNDGTAAATTSSSSSFDHRTTVEYPPPNYAMPCPTVVSPTPIRTTASGNSFHDQFAIGANVEPPQRQDNGTAVASHAKLRISNSITAQKRIAAAESLPHGLKRKNDDVTLVDELALFPNSTLRRDVFSSPLPSRAKISREEQISQAESPLHSLAQVAVEVAAAAAAAGCFWRRIDRRSVPPFRRLRFDCAASVPIAGTTAGAAKAGREQTSDGRQSQVEHARPAQRAKQHGPTWNAAV